MLYEANKTVQDADEERVVELLRKLSASGRSETIVRISGRRSWYGLLWDAGVIYWDARSERYCEPGLYLITEWMGEGLEFDNVVVDYVDSVSEDEEEEKRLCYVHFTRARKRLYIRYRGTPPQFLSQYYAVFWATGVTATLLHEEPTADGPRADPQRHLAWGTPFSWRRVPDSLAPRRHLLDSRSFAAPVSAGRLGSAAALVEN